MKRGEMSRKTVERACDEVGRCLEVDGRDGNGVLEIYVDLANGDESCGKEYLNLVRVVNTDPDRFMLEMLRRGVATDFQETHMDMSSVRFVRFSDKESWL